MTINKRQLKENDRLRIITHSNKLTNPISTKLSKVADFKLNQLLDVINTLEYKEIDLETCKIVIQSIKIPTGRGRLYLSRQTVNKKNVLFQSEK